MNKDILELSPDELTASVVCSLIAGASEKLVKALTHDGFIVKDHSHSTARQINIYAVDGDEELLVWYKTNWESSHYEFNEKGKTIGIQPACQFAKPILMKFFNDLLEARQYCIRGKRTQKVADAVIAESAYLDKAKRFKEKFGKQFEELG